MSTRFCIFTRVLGEMIHYCTDSLPIESGGVLLGRMEQNVVHISAFIPAIQAVGTFRSIHFDHRTWANINLARRELPQDLLTCGWFHSHPAMGPFLSPEDYQIQQDLYRYHYQTALVIDPVREEFAFFGQRDGALASIPVFLEGKIS